MNMRLIAGIFVTLGLSVLTGCNMDERNPTTPSADPDEGRYHEKSFSWTETTGPLAKGSALAALASQETRFASDDEMFVAVQALEEQLKDKGFTDSLWKPVDYACDELDLAVWNVYGKVVVGDSVVFDEGVLKGRCRPSEEIADTMLGHSDPDSEGLTKTSFDWRWWKEVETEHRVYPYKLIGRSWDDFNLGVYKSTGGETQFKKHREKFWMKKWWDTDASRIGVRIYLIDCSSTPPRECVINHSQSSWYANDDYVSKRELVTGGKFKAYAPTPGNGWTSDVKSVDAFYIKRFNVATAVYSMHSASHAGIQFRAESSSGVDNAPVSPGPISALEFVTW